MVDQCHLSKSEVSRNCPPIVTEVTLGNDTYALCNVRTRHRNRWNVPAPRRTVGAGRPAGNNVVCPWHAWEWTADRRQRFHPSRRFHFTVQVDGDDILLEVPERA